jgi:transcriptional regulator of acetoin/glycerol metabolism
MSKLGIGLFYFALVGALAAAVFGALLIQKFQTSQATLAQTQTSLNTSKKETVTANQKADAANQATQQATTELKESNDKVDDLTGKLAAQQKAQDDLNTQLTGAKTDADTAKKALQHVTDVLGTMTPEDALAAVKKGQADLAAAQAQQKILEDQVQASQKQIADLHDAINRSKIASMPPGISGKVTFVNRPWNFVVLNIGLSNGVVPNGELIVYRGRNFLGKIKVTSAEDNTAVADILPNAKADIQVGDDVLN